MHVFIPKGRETYYCRITVPLRLWSLVGRKEVWRSLLTTNRGLAEVRAGRWRASEKRLFHILKREGLKMNKAMIDELVQRWLDEALDEYYPWHPQREDDLQLHSESLHESYLDN